MTTSRGLLLLERRAAAEHFGFLSLLGLGVLLLGVHTPGLGAGESPDPAGDAEPLSGVQDKDQPEAEEEEQEEHEEEEWDEEEE